MKVIYRRLLMLGVLFFGTLACYAQPPILSNVFIRAGRGILLGYPSVQEPGVMGYSTTTGLYVVWNTASNAFVPIAVSGAGGGSLTGLQIQVRSGSSNNLAYSNNPATPALGYLTYILTNGSGSYLPTTGGSVTGGVIITGGLTVYGTQTIYNAVVINSYTQYNLGVSTNFIYTTVYSTNIVYQTTELNIQTNITYSTIDAYSGWNFIGAYLNATGAPYVYTPHFRDTLTNRLDANGVWSFSNATVVGLSVLGGGSATQDVRSSVSGLSFTNNALSTVAVLVETGRLALANGLLSSSAIELPGGQWLTYSGSAATNNIFVQGLPSGRLTISGAVDIVTAQSVPFTVNGGTYLSTNAVLTGGNNVQLVVSNANGLVYLSVSSNTVAAVTNAVQTVVFPGGTGTPTRLEFEESAGNTTTGRVAGSTATVYVASSVGVALLTTNNNFTSGTTNTFSNSFIVAKSDGTIAVFRDTTNNAGLVIRSSAASGTAPIQLQLGAAASRAAIKVLDRSGYAGGIWSHEDGGINFGLAARSVLNPTTGTRTSDDTALDGYFMGGGGTWYLGSFDSGATTRRDALSWTMSSASISASSINLNPVGDGGVAYSGAYVYDNHGNILFHAHLTNSCVGIGGPSLQNEGMLVVATGTNRANTNVAIKAFGATRATRWSPSNGGPPGIGALATNETGSRIQIYFSAYVTANNTGLGGVALETYNTEVGVIVTSRVSQTVDIVDLATSVVSQNVFLVGFVNTGGTYKVLDIGGSTVAPVILTQEWNTVKF